MSKKTLFKYAVLLHEEIKNEDGKVTDIETTLLKEPTITLEINPKIVAMKAVRDLDEKYIPLFDQIQILIQPEFSKVKNKNKDSDDLLSFTSYQIQDSTHTGNPIYLANDGEFTASTGATLTYTASDIASLEACCS